MEQYHLKVATIFSAAIGLFIAALAITKRNRATSDYLLAALNLMIFFMMIFTHTFFMGYITQGTFAKIHVSGLSLTLPIFYLYIKSFSEYRLFHKPKTYVHTTLLIIVMLALLFSQDQISESKWPILLLYLIAFPMYLALSLKQLSKHQAYILTKFSYTEDIDLSWLNRMLWGAGLIWLSMVIFFIIPKRVLEFDRSAVLEVPIFLTLFFKFYIGIYGVRQANILLDPAIQPPEKVEPPLTSKTYQQLSDERLENIAANIRKEVGEQQLFLDPEFNLKKLAEITDVPQVYISQVLNQHLGKNFYDFINEYRVEAFKQLIADAAHKKYSLLSLALEAGFKSKSSFNNAFKKYTGSTPSDYIKRHTI